MILVLVPKSPKRRSDTDAAPPPLPPPPTPALSLLSPWEVLQLKVAHVPMGKMTRDAGIPNFVQDSATVSPSPVGMWRFM